MSDKSDKKLGEMPIKTASIKESIEHLQSDVKKLPTQRVSTTDAKKLSREYKENIKSLNTQFASIRTDIYGLLHQKNSLISEEDASTLKTYTKTLSDLRGEIVKQCPLIQTDHYKNRYRHITYPLEQPTQSSGFFSSFSTQPAAPEAKEPFSEVLGISAIQYIEKFGLDQTEYSREDLAIAVQAEAEIINKKNKYLLKINTTGDEKKRKKTGTIYLEYATGENPKESSVQYTILPSYQNPMITGTISLQAIVNDDKGSTDIHSPTVETLTKDPYAQKIRDIIHKNGHFDEIEGVKLQSAQKVADTFIQNYLHKLRTPREDLVTLMTIHLKYVETNDREAYQNLFKHIEALRLKIILGTASTLSTPDSTPDSSPLPLHTPSGSPKKTGSKSDIRVPLEEDSPKKTGSESNTRLLTDDPQNWSSPPDPAPDSGCPRVKRALGTFSCVALAGTILTGAIGLPLGFTKQPIATQAAIANIPGGSQTIHTLSHSLAAQVLIPIAVAALLTLLAYGSYRLARSEAVVSRSLSPLGKP